MEVGKEASGMLSNKQILELYTNPVVMVAAPGENKVLIPLSCYVEHLYGGKLPFNSGAISVTYGNRVDESHGQTLAVADAPFDITEDCVQYITPNFYSLNEAHGISLSDCINKPLTLTADGDFYDGSGGTGRFHVVYKIINVS